MRKKDDHIIYYVFSNWGNAHQMARLIGLEKESVDSEILGYVRNIYPSGLSRDIVALGKVSPGNYASRILQYIKALWILIKRIPSGATTFVFGFDNLMLLVLSNLLGFKKRKIIYEIADIQPFQLKGGFKGKAIRFLEKQLFRSINLAVITSPEFVTGFYNQHQYPQIATIWLENKMNTFALKQVKSTGIEKLSKADKNDTQFTIGLFGMIRCQRSIEVLDQLTRQDSRFRVVIRGVLMPGVKKLESVILANSSFFFMGSYISPTDLEEMYSEIDLAWIAYPYSSKQTGNWKWARTNRFYEAGFHNVPMIASLGTMDGERVINHEIGKSVDLSSIDQAVSSIQQISEEELESWRNNLRQIPEETFVVTDDYSKLKQRLIELKLI